MLHRLVRTNTVKPIFVCLVCQSTVAENRTYLDNWLGKRQGASRTDTTSSDCTVIPERMSNTPSLSTSISTAEPVRRASAALPESSQSMPITMVHSGVVRSGQQIFAKEQSLVVMGNVNHGAELLADGDIHVYGRLSGRAVVGLNGNYMAKIFIRQFEASLIGVADCFIIPFEEEINTHDQRNIEKDQFAQRNVLKSMFGKSVVVSVKTSTKGIEPRQSHLPATSSLKNAVIRLNDASDGTRMDMCVSLMP